MEDRRLAAIMFTDIVGYTALMGRDEDKAFQILRKNREIQRPLIKKYHGEWLKEMGDGILASFNSSSDAVRCADEIQQAAKKEGIALRIGIHEGEVVFEGGDVLGDGVNVASRLEEMAEKGCINVSGAVYKDIKNKAGIKTEFLEEKTLKNVDEPIKIYRVSCEEFLEVISGTITSDSTLPDKKSIIVLPFVNISPDPDQEYFSDGLTEEIITDLSFIHDLLVISRNSAMTFKGTKLTTLEIAEKVNVHYVLEGSVRKAGNNLRIIAQLIDAKNDTHLWAEKYSGTLDDVFDIQEKVSRSIVDALKLKLSPDEDKKIEEKTIDNVHAYECYMRARQEVLKYTDDSLQRALKYLTNGLNIIGENILFYSGIGYVYYQYFDTGLRTDKDYGAKAEEYADKIFKLDPDSSHGHRLIGLVKLKRENTLEAYKHLKQAYISNPNDWDTLFWLIPILGAYLGKILAARPLVKKALEIDPLTPSSQAIPAILYWMEGRFDLALEYYDKWRQMEPDSLVAKWYFAQLLLWNHRVDEANKFIDEFAIDASGYPLSQLILFLKFAYQKKKKEAYASFNEEAKNLAWNDFHLPWYVAECFSLLDEREEAMRWLEHAVDRKFINYPLFAKLDPFLENIRGENRFKKLMKRVKHEWESFEV